MTKPPLGLKPYHFWVEDRIEDLQHAIFDKILLNQEIPREWIDEVNYLNIEKTKNEGRF